MIRQNRILALHGFTGRGSDFMPLQELCPRTGPWYFPDLPGHGPENQVDCHADATIEYIDRVARENPDCRILLGYSMGGRAALLHALSRPDYWKAVILIGANPGISDPLARRNRQQEDAVLAERIHKDGVRVFISHWQEHPLITTQENIDPEWRAAMQAARKEHTAKGLANSLRQFGQGSIPDLWPKLDELKCPTQLITGALDRKYTEIAKKMLLHLPEGSHSTLAAAGHMAHLEKAKAAAAVINDFIQKVA